MFLTDFRKTLETGMDPPLKTDSLTFLSTTVSRKIRKTREVPLTKTEDNSSPGSLGVPRWRTCQIPDHGAMPTCQNPYPGEGSLSQFPVGSPTFPPPPPPSTLGLNIDRCIIPSNTEQSLCRPLLFNQSATIAVSLPLNASKFVSAMIYQPM